MLFAIIDSCLVSSAACRAHTCLHVASHIKMCCATTAATCALPRQSMEGMPICIQRIGWNCAFVEVRRGAVACLRSCCSLCICVYVCVHAFPTAPCLRSRCCASERCVWVGDRCLSLVLSFQHSFIRSVNRPIPSELGS
jgi:hypothetical protein